MYYSLKGKITHVLGTSVVIDVNNVSYEIFVSKPSSFLLNEIITIYTYLYSNEMEEYLIGFKDLKEKEMFISLLSVRGIGPKTSLNILSKASPIELMNAIENGNILYLKRLPGVGNKSANQIVLDLQGKLLSNEENKKHEKIRNALKGLGFTLNEIDNALKLIVFSNKSDEEVLKEALQILRK